MNSGPQKSGPQPATHSEAAGRYWRVVAGSVCGSSHARCDRTCQDAHAWQLFPGGLLVAAVADGAGSAALGAVGAELAARRSVELLRRGEEAGRVPASGGTAGDAWRALLREVVAEVRGALLEEAVVRDVSPRELATTLILAAATPGLIAVAQVGDGAAVLRDGTGEFTALTRPTGSEYVNHTTFVVSEDALESVQMEVWFGSATHVALFTDGLQRLALRMPEGDPHAPFFAPLLRFAEEATDLEEANRQLAAFLGSARIRERTDDDVTLLLATLNP